MSDTILSLQRELEKEKRKAKEERERKELKKELFRVKNRKFLGIGNSFVGSMKEMGKSIGSGFEAAAKKLEESDRKIREKNKKKGDELGFKSINIEID